MKDSTSNCLRENPRKENPSVVVGSLLVVAENSVIVVVNSIDF